MSASASLSLVKQKYRSLGRLINKLPKASGAGSLCPERALEDLRTAFRKPLKEDESLDQKLSEADKKVSFLKMVTPKAPGKNNSGRWVYTKDGKRVEGTSQKRDKNGRVISNWDGKNLDPDSVKQHNYQLKRMGFRNNAHAKGFF